MDSPEPTRTAFHDALTSLAELSIVIPPHRRASLFQDVLSFRPAYDLGAEFALGPLRAAFAEVWEARFGTAVPMQKLQYIMTPPVAIGRVLEFTRLGIAGDFDELADSLHQLLTYLADEVSKLSSSTQRLLFTDESADRHGGPATVVGGRTVTSLVQLVDQGVTFPTIYADPPWQYDNDSARGAAGRHYSTMSVEEICTEPVRKLAAKNAHLHLWTTNGFLREAFDVITAWGFKFKSCLVWVKEGLGTGNYWRVSHEFLLLGVRGRLTFRDQTLGSWVLAPRSTHSRKPGNIRTLVERVSPGPYLELYGREELPNSAWTVYGNQVERRLF